MDEFEIIRRFFTRRYPDESIRVGNGDDGAVVAPPLGEEIVSVVDSLVAGVHFPLHLDASDIGYRVVAVNLSDIAAMGARPRWMTLALTLARQHADASWLQGFADGMFECADKFGVALIGGDTTRGTELVATVSLMGTIAAGRAMRRSGAKTGDCIFVTGTPGDAAAGLNLMQGGGTDDSRASALVSRFKTPDPRVEFGAELKDLASAAIDLSDGLAGDLLKLLDASGVGGRIDAGSLPLSAHISQFFDRKQAVDFALHGGDDYELCFTASGRRTDQVTALGNRVGVRVSEIGVVTEGAGLSCTYDGKAVELRHGGYSHFSAAEPA